VVLRNISSGVHQLLVTANIVPNSLIRVTLMMEVLRSPETWVLTGAKWCNTPEDGILHIHTSFIVKPITFSCNWNLYKYYVIDQIKMHVSNFLLVLELTVM
jgi:hypothetical protein